MHWVFWVFIFIIIIAIAVVYLRSSVLPSQSSAYISIDQPSQQQIWSANIERETLDNTAWRRVLTTADGLQVVAMNTPPGESLGWEVHKENDQFFRVESGEGVLSTASLCEGNATKPVQKIELRDGMSALVPRGICHNVMNTGKKPLLMYTIYGPKHHPPGTVDVTHADEIARESRT
jgi:mannose-6-phosphate isomerase-like protein (cupin superfamily)